ncbi:hypothetical protein [Anaerobacillus sp. 1_MG-2023]|uniref:hypothetical protein n=1 Tax=Anaerobacillus sp. 1_MG-2023 TaxID=3062655 RepID=UPI0026E3DEE6|nr:hypothetical protein [Anaerobacillus sp. 1_MG-2023]MDO6657393.1 hypothetical protein [Anaerobacillus sp. 1_MG-2023]
MKFNTDKFLEELKKADLTEQFRSKRKPGTAVVIKEIWNHARVSSVDFDSFTYEDVISALDEMANIEGYSDDDGGEVFVCDPGNGFMVYNDIETLIFNLHNVTGRLYTQEDDEIFI